jgi:hypothetical protein
MFWPVLPLSGVGLGWSAYVFWRDYGGRIGKRTLSVGERTFSDMDCVSVQENVR